MYTTKHTATVQEDFKKRMYTWEKKCFPVVALLFGGTEKIVLLAGSAGLNRPW